MKRKRDYKKEYRRRKQLKALRDEQLAFSPKSRKKRRKRNYKKEYQRKKVLALKVIVRRDAKRVFGKKPKRQGGEGGEMDAALRGLSLYSERLEEIKRDVPSVFDWTDEQGFIRALTNKGMPIQEAYTMWFSP